MIQRQRDGLVEFRREQTDSLDQGSNKSDSEPTTTPPFFSFRLIFGSSERSYIICICPNDPCRISDNDLGSFGLDVKDTIFVRLIRRVIEWNCPL
jgi:hypothetical protein